MNQTIKLVKSVCERMLDNICADLKDINISTKKISHDIAKYNRCDYDRVVSYLFKNFKGVKEKPNKMLTIQLTPTDFGCPILIPQDDYYFEERWQWENFLLVLDELTTLVSYSVVNDSFIQTRSTYELEN